MNTWWGYLHENGSVQVKRFISRCDIEDAVTSPFVQKVVLPFMAKDREDALEKAREKLEV